MARLAPIRWLQKVGVDRPIAYGIASHCWRVLAGPVGLFLIATFLTRTEQGYYYTFASILGLSLVLELGLDYVVVQFASHEMAALAWSHEGVLQGDPAAKGRLAAVLKFSLKWYAVATVLGVVLVAPAGYWFFGRSAAEHPEVAWQTSWVWAAVVTGLNLSLNPFLALLEGTGLIAAIGRLRLAQVVTGNVVLWTALCSKAALAALPLTAGASFILTAAWLIATKRKGLMDLLRSGDSQVPFSWRSELLPMQWKITVACISNYLLFQVSNPVLFTYQGPAVAGQMGLSLTIMAAVFAVGATWVNTKGPVFGTLIARREYQLLDKTFFRALGQSIGVVLAGVVLVVAAVGVLNLTGHRLSQRIVSPAAFAVLSIALLAYHVYDCEATYMHAHKREPFLLISLVAGTSIALSTFLLGRAWGAWGVIVGWAALVPIVVLGLGTLIFFRKRREWQRQGEAAVRHLRPEGSPPQSPLHWVQNQP